MATQELVEAQARPADEARTKNAARRVRRGGNIPAVVYGAKKDSVAVTVNPKQISRILHSESGHNTVFDLKVGGDQSKAMIVDWQYEPIKGTLLLRQQRSRKVARRPRARRKSEAGRRSGQSRHRVPVHAAQSWLPDHRSHRRAVQGRCREPQMPGGYCQGEACGTRSPAGKAGDLHESQRAFGTKAG